jgi:hypothetical protein
MKKAEIFSTLGHITALSIHFLLNLNIIPLYLFCMLSLIPPISFGFAGYLNKDRAFIIGQVGWILIAIFGIIENI